MTCKNRAMLRSTSAVPELYPDEAFQPTASVRSATFTNTYRRAVSVNASAKVIFLNKNL